MQTECVSSDLIFETDRQGHWQSFKEIHVPCSFLASENLSLQHMDAIKIVDQPNSCEVVHLYSETLFTFFPYLYFWNYARS